jgi:hypothetical protein
VTLEIRRGQRPKIKLAIPAFRAISLPSEATAAAKENEAVVRADLDLSGYFEIQGPESFGGLRLTGNPADDVPVLRSVGNEILILAEEKNEGDRIPGRARARLRRRHSGALPRPH